MQKQCQPEAGSITKINGAAQGLQFFNVIRRTIGVHRRKHQQKQAEHTRTDCHRTRDELLLIQVENHRRGSQQTKGNQRDNQLNRIEIR